MQQPVSGQQLDFFVMLLVSFRSLPRGNGDTDHYVAQRLEGNYGALVKSGQLIRRHEGKRKHIRWFVVVQVPAIEFSYYFLVHKRHADLQAIANRQHIEHANKGSLEPSHLTFPYRNLGGYYYAPSFFQLQSSPVDKLSAGDVSQSVSSRMP